jgi:hypothetical protein
VIERLGRTRESPFQERSDRQPSLSFHQHGDTPAQLARRSVYANWATLKSLHMFRGQDGMPEIIEDPSKVGCAAFVIWHLHQSEVVAYAIHQECSENRAVWRLDDYAPSRVRLLWPTRGSTQDAMANSSVRLRYDGRLSSLRFEICRNSPPSATDNLPQIRLKQASVPGCFAALFLWRYFPD